MTPEERAWECCSWWGIEGPGRVIAVTKAIASAENDALERAAQTIEGDGEGLTIETAYHCRVIRALKHKDAG